MMFTAIWSRPGGGRRGPGSSLAGPSQADEVGFAAVSIASDRQPLMALSGPYGTIEIEFAAGARMRITGAVDAAMLSAVVAALTDGRPR